jgi:hypothetical protein
MTGNFNFGIKLGSELQFASEIDLISEYLIYKSLIEIV